MADAHDAQPAKLLIGMLSAFPEALADARDACAERWGAIDLASDLWPHEFTDYYAPQMGEPLVRQFITFQPLIDPADLAEIKRTTNAIEADLAAAGRWPVPRPVNLDPGIITPAKLVLASCKDFAHRVYLGGGVHAEVTLRYVGGKWACHEWTFPDYRIETYHAFFDRVRTRLMAQLKETASA